MQQFGQFFINHWDLFAALAIILLMLFGGGISRRLRGYEEVAPLEAVGLMNHKDAVLIDVREDKEFQDGHILGARHIPLGKLSGALAGLENLRGKPIIVGCRSGARSASGCAVLRKNGFEEVYNLKGGMLAWQNANLPVNRESKGKKGKK